MKKKLTTERMASTQPPGPTRPFRGSAKFRKPATSSPAREEPEAGVTGTRTRNLSRTRGTLATQTTHKSTRKSPRTFVTQQPISIVPNLDSLLEEVDMPPKQIAPLDFKPSPLFGITMDEFNDFDRDAIEKMHETFQPRLSVQNGFFPVIENGTPSTLL